MKLRRTLGILTLSVGVCVAGFASRSVAANAAAVPAVGAMPWVAGDSAPAFVPGGSRVVFARGKGTARRLYVSHESNGHWSEPERAPFSAAWMDIEPAMAPDGSYLVFVSNRPARSGGKALDGYFGGKLHVGRGGNLWRVASGNGAWGVPVRLPDIVNASPSTYSPAVAADGSLYFTRPDPGTRHTRLYVSRRVDGRYQTPQAVPFSDGAVSDYDPAVAPDQSFIVFSSDRAPTPANHSGLFIAFARHAGWSTPVALNVYGYEARLGPEPGTLYFNDDADGRIRKLSIAGVLARHAAAGRR